MSDLAELRFRARELAGLVDTDFDTSPVDIDRFVNTAYRAWVEAYDWPFLRDELEVATQPGESDYGPQGVEVARVRGVWVREENYYRRLRPRPHTEFYTATEDGSGTPREYAVLTDQTVRLYPVPDRAYEMRVEVLLDTPRLADDADEPLIPEHFREGLALMAASRILRRRRASGDVGRADDLDQEAGALLESMRRRELLDHDPSRSVLGGRFNRHGRGVFVHGAR